MVDINIIDNEKRDGEPYKVLSRTELMGLMMQEQGYHAAKQQLEAAQAQMDTVEADRNEVLAELGLTDPNLTKFDVIYVTRSLYIRSDSAPLAAVHPAD